MANIDGLLEAIENEPKDKKAEFHRNLRIAFTSLGIVVFAMSAIVNYYTIQKLKK